MLPLERLLFPCGRVKRCVGFSWTGICWDYLGCLLFPRGSFLQSGCVGLFHVLHTFMETCFELYHLTCTMFLEYLNVPGEGSGTKGK